MMKLQKREGRRGSCRQGKDTPEKEKRTAAEKERSGETAKATLSREERMRRRRRQVWVERIVLGLASAVILAGGILGLRRLLIPKEPRMEYYGSVKEPKIDVQLLTVNEYSRPGLATDPIRGVVIHYTANPGSTAQNNRDYFENLKDTHYTKASSNFIVGLNGEIIQCVPTSEIAYASNDRNIDTVSIECCHPDETGEFTDATYQSVVELTAYLLAKFGLTEDAAIRHYDVTGKDCPRYFVAHEDAWEAFKEDVGAILRQYE